MTPLEIALRVGEGLLAQGPDVVAFVTAHDGPARVAALIRAEQAALAAGRSIIDDEIAKKPHRPEGG